MKRDAVFARRRRRRDIERETSRADGHCESGGRRRKKKILEEREIRRGERLRAR
jgi:hypothetical protein